MSGHEVQQRIAGVHSTLESMKFTPPELMGERLKQLQLACAGLEEAAVECEDVALAVVKSMRGFRVEGFDDAQVGPFLALVLDEMERRIKSVDDEEQSDQE